MAPIIGPSRTALATALAWKSTSGPYLVRGSQIVLQPGMTFSDEPGIYQVGKFGIRLEDIMAITENGAEMMTPTQSSLSPMLSST
jgi:Xaa-Pro aminopeptidase